MFFGGSSTCVIVASSVTTLGKYTLLRKLATGGMAEVFLARADGPMGFAKKCVVKRILPHFNDDPRFIEMFLGEARLAAELNHPNLVQIFDFGQHQGQYYLAMEYIDGANLRVLNQATRSHQGPMSLPLAARLISLAAEGLHFAHELRDEEGEFLNLVHRDISPDNVLVAKNGSVKVVDFGIAKASSQPHLTKSGMIKGKLAYMAPEHLAREPLDRRADLFALGIVLYELVTGGMPFDATSEVSIIQAILSLKPLEKATVYRPDCPPDLEAIVVKCLEKDRNLRYASCVELQADLEKFIRGSGETVGTREVASLLATVLPNEANTTVPDAVVPESGAHPPLALVDTQGTASGTGMSKTALSSVRDRPGRARLFAVGATALAVGVAAAGWYVTRPDPLSPKPEVVVTAIDAGGVGVTAFEPDAGTKLVEADAGFEVVAADPVKPAAPKNGRLELRIRPYATVFLDDKKLGDTPLPPVWVAVGKHKLRLVNPAFGKSVELNIVIKPGENIVKHNLKE